MNRVLLTFLLLIAQTALHAVDLAFPKLADAKPVRGELTSADFIHRSGQFHTEKGELLEFTMPPYAVMKYRGAEADLREIPLGTKMTFLMVPDENGHLTRLVTTDDEQPADEAQRQKFIEFTKARGLPGWIEKTEGKQMVVTLFSGDPKNFQKTWMDDFAVGKNIKICVSNDELRTWNVNVDGKGGAVRDVQSVPADGFGSSGVRLVLTVSDMLEGFRKGRVVRIYGQSWPQKDFFAESLMNYGVGALLATDFRECPPKHYPDQFPFRTDYGNAHLPWYQITEGTPPPRWSEHLVLGELVKVDAANSSGQFRTERSGELMDFTLLASGATVVVNEGLPAQSIAPVKFQPKLASVRYQNADATLADLPLGQRYRFHMYQDKSGAFTRCSLISDEHSHLTQQHLTYRVTASDPKNGRLEVAWQHPDITNYQRDMESPPPFGHSLLRVTPETRVWKADQPVSLTDIKPGDLLLVNLTSEQKDKPAHCTDLWVTEAAGRTAPKAQSKESKGTKKDKAVKPK